MAISWMARLGGLAIAAACVVPASAQRPANYPRSYDDLVAVARGERMVRIYANADADEVAPVVAAFRRRYSGIVVHYADIGSANLYKRFVAETAARRASADIVWSSAMDLQVKLINDGYAQAYASPEKPALPATAVWKNMGYGITAEPIAILYNKRLIPPALVPRTHAALETLLRTRVRAFTGRVITFDPTRSNVGYLYLSEDLSTTRDTWSLVRAIGATRPVLTTKSEAMLQGVASGRQAIAYNIIGSYAIDRAKRMPNLGVVFPSDYTIVTSRIAFIAEQARHPAAAKLFLDFLLSREGQTILARRSLSPVRRDVRVAVARPSLEQARPIRVGPQLLVNLDRIKRQRFLRAWNAALISGETQ